MRRALAVPKSSQCSSASGKSLFAVVDVRVDEGVVRLLVHARMAVAQVEGVLQQLLPVGADVQHDRERAVGVDPAGRGVDGEFALGDVDAADAPVADAQDRLTVGRHDQVDVAGPETGAAQRVLDLLGGVHGEIDSVRAAELVAVALDRGADGRGVDDRQHLAEVVADEPVEQHLVAVVQTGQIDVLGEVGGLRTVLRVGAHRLLVLGEGLRRHQAHQAQCRAFLRREGRAAVEPWIGEYGPARRGGLEAVFPGDPLGAHERSPVVGPRRRGRILGYAGMWMTSLISGSRRTGGMCVCVEIWAQGSGPRIAMFHPLTPTAPPEKAAFLRPRGFPGGPVAVGIAPAPYTAVGLRRGQVLREGLCIARRRPGFHAAGPDSPVPGSPPGRRPTADCQVRSSCWSSSSRCRTSRGISRWPPHIRARHSPHGAGMQPQQHHPTGCPSCIPPGMHRPR